MNTISQVNTPSTTVTSESAAPGNTWNYAAASGGIVNTSDVAAKAAAGSGVRNYIKSCDIVNRSATATEVVIKDGSTVLWRCELGQSEGVSRVFTPPLRGSANTAVNVACITTAAKVYANLSGYTDA